MPAAKDTTPTDTETDPQVPTHGALTASIEATHERALNALIERRAAPLDAIGWLSAHKSATEHVLVPLARRHKAPALVC